MVRVLVGVGRAAHGGGLPAGGLERLVRRGGIDQAGSDGFHAAAGFPVVSPCFPAFFTDSTSSQKSLWLLSSTSTTTPCFPAFFTVPERPTSLTSVHSV